MSDTKPPRILPPREPVDLAVTRAEIHFSPFSRIEAASFSTKARALSVGASLKRIVTAASKFFMASIWLFLISLRSLVTVNVDYSTHYGGVKYIMRAVE